MKTLILCNSAPNYINYFYNLGKEIKEQGDDVVFALECYLIEKKFDVEIKEFKKYYFSDYFQANKSYEKIEKNYNENLRVKSYPDYNRFEHWEIDNIKFQDIDLIIANLIDYFEKIIIEEKIEVIIYENVSNVFSYIAYLVAKKNRIKYMGLIQSRLENRFEILEDPFGDIEKRKNLYKEYSQVKLSESEREKYLNYIKNIDKLKPNYMKNNITSKDVKYLNYYIKKIKNGQLKILLNYYKEYYFKIKNKESYELGNPIEHSIKMLKRNIIRKIRIKYLENKFDNPRNEKYMIYPIHYQPESSTSVNSPFNCSQIEVIEKIAFSLPLGMKLYVKEHPNAIGFFNKNFYKKLKRIPNVKYISPMIEITELIKNSEGIVTLTSTVGFEALLLKKMVITLGDVFYNYHPKIKNIKNYEDLYSKIMEKDDFEITDNENEIFLKVYFETTYEGVLRLSEKNENKNQIENIVNKIKIKYQGCEDNVK